MFVEFECLRENHLNVITFKVSPASLFALISVISKFPEIGYQPNAQYKCDHLHGGADAKEVAA
jgi:hypothetical protein